MSSSNRQIVACRATDVLSEFTHSLVFPAGSSYAIIYGPNGVGKTKFLEIINAVSNLESFTLLRQPFGSASVEFDDGSKLTARREAVIAGMGLEQDEIDPYGEHRITYELLHDGKKYVWEAQDRQIPPLVRRRLENRGWERVSEYFWRDPSDGEQIHIDELVRRYSTAPPRGHLNDLDAQASEDEATIRNFVREVSTFLIETQRLKIDVAQVDRRYDRSPNLAHGRSKIEKQAESIRDLLTGAQTEHSRITQRLDRTFPNRVLQAAGESADHDPQAIREAYDRQNEFRSQLGRVASVALDEELPLPDGDLDSWALTLLRLYVADAELKLAPFEKILPKVKLLEEIVNTRFIGKTLEVNNANGLEVRRVKDNQVVPLDYLSSGEQHELILMIDLLFNVPEGALVMIDEPEISLHVAWQVAFIADVKRISELVRFRFIVATHSPQIINGDWDKATRLGPEALEL